MINYSCPIFFKVLWKIISLLTICLSAIRAEWNFVNMDIAPNLPLHGVAWNYVKGCEKFPTSPVISNKLITYQSYCNIVAERLTKRTFLHLIDLTI